MNREHNTTSRGVRGYVHAGLGGALAFAAALFVAAPPAAAQDPVDVSLESCNAGEGIIVCGFVWNDANGNGFQDGDETGLDSVTVTATIGVDTYTTTTDLDGVYMFNSQTLTPGIYTISIDATVMPSGTLGSPTNQGIDDTSDSDGHDNGTGQSYVVVDVADTFTSQAFDFGFHTPEANYPGTGTPGYWKNHPDAWPVSSIVVGGLTYTKAEAIAWLGKVGKDKTTTMFSSLVPAMLNVQIGNPSNCITSTIVAADAWMAAHPVGSKVAAGSTVWAEGEPLHKLMDAYNNGLLCAPHRN